MAKRKREPDTEQVSDWDHEEKLSLLVQLQECCPEGDRLSYTTRGNKIDWEKVAFNGRSAQQCQAAWTHMLSKVRKFRTMQEVVSDAKDMVLHPNKYSNKSNSKKKFKHPDQPTKPLTSYFQYVQDHRAKFKAKHPELSQVELIKMMTQRWQSLSPSKQEKYNRRYKAQWQEFQEANAKFLEEHPEMKRKPVGSKPQPPSPFLLYSRAKQQALKEKHPQLGSRAVQKKLKRKYSKLKPEKKKKWIDRALDAIPQYEEEVRKYQQTHPDYTPPDAKVRLTREEAVLNGDVSEPVKKMRMTNKFPGAPQKPARSAYLLFVKKKMAGVSGRFTEKMAELGSQWKALGTKQNKYYKKLQAQQEAYQLQLQEYKQTLTEEQLALFEESLLPKNKRERKSPATA